MQKVRHDQSCRAQCRITRCDRCSNNTDDCEHTAYRTQPRTGDFIYNQRREVRTAVVVRGKRLQTAYTVKSLLGIGKERAGSRSPDKRKDTFSHHGAVEDPPTLPFVSQAARHDRRLRAVKTRYSAASNTHEHHREERQTIRLAVLQTVSEFGHCTAVLRKHNNSYSDAHKQQHAAEDGIEAADQLIHRQDGSQGIVSEDNQHPGYRQRPAVERHRAERSQALQQRSRTGEERGGKQQ